MATFHGNVVESWTVASDPDAALAFFGDLDQNIGHSVELDQHEKLDGATVRMVLKQQRSGRTTYKPTYTLRWTTDPDTRTLRWESLEEKGSTMRIVGVARFRGPPGGPTTIEWDEKVAADVPVNRLVGKAIAPVAQGLIRKGIRGFVERMITDLVAGG